VLVGIAGGAVTLVGVLLTGPVLVPALMRLAGLPLRGWIPGRLAVSNAVRNPGRAASTSVALFVGVSLVTMMTVGAASATGAADRSIGKQYPLDVTVTAPEGAALPASVVDRIGRLPQTQSALALPGTPVTLGEAGPVDVLGADPAAFARVWRGADQGLRDGVALVPRDVAGQLDLKDGDTLRLPVGTGTGTGTGTGAGSASGPAVALRVRTSAVPAVVVTPNDLHRVATSTPVRALFARATSDADPSAYRTAVREEVRGVTGARTGGFITQRAEIADAVTIVLRVVLALLGAALVIAIVGIANTLALSVLERSRELAVQRALGMTRRQLRAGLTAEALLLALVGAVLGIVLGIGYGWAGARSLFGGTVSDVPLVVPWGQVGAMALVAALAGALASVLPGRRAARSSPVAALGAE
jgi:putative ABC transport system permease protein